ncbi:Asp-tRNA(Asn)/Glu-tRNA(Gln) amidotransferase subunit GatA [Rickettsiales bacterium]|nr:Asp-tRNA(Asn)/Glu-tRNA(Gln) amidotransferase subunit GatA [Rickettsiales bacterium]
MTDFSDLTIYEARLMLQKKKISSVELTKYFIEKISQSKNLNCFITETFDEAMKMAKSSDDKIQSSEEIGLMQGIPIAMKDLFCTKDIRTTAGSKILENFVPFYESTVSENLLNDGAVMLGKSNLDEFAMGSANTTSYYGNVVNPWKSKNNKNLDLVPGGSSGGSASAVSAKLCLGATGSDTGGSIRQPAAFCGLVGMKPTYGRCSRFGMVAFASSLDQAGPITKNVLDSSIMLESMCSYDPKDSTSSKINIPNFSELVKLGVKGKILGIPKEYKIDGLNSEIQKNWEQGIDWLKSDGAEVVEISLPHSSFALPTYYIIAPAEASANLARYDGIRFGLREQGKDLEELYKNTRASGFGNEVKRRIMIGTYVLSAGYYDAYYLKALKVRQLISDDFSEAFKKCDFILTPTTPGVAFGLNEKQNDPLEMYLNDVLTVPASLAGLPAISIPSGLNNDGLPIGLQIISKPFDEEMCLRAGYVIEKYSNFKEFK